jgi:hypothetical protein
MTLGYRDFEFDLPRALLTELVDVLDDTDPAPLHGGLPNIPEEQGVYQIFLDDELVYIGKTDAEAGLQQRLSRHARKTSKRHGLDPKRLSFKAVRIFVFTAMDLETQLIRHYAGEDGTLWNGSGFGANDPGRKRDKSKPGRFDQEFRINIDYALPVRFGGTQSAAEVAAKLKANIPHTFRYEAERPRARTPHPDLARTTVTMPNTSMSAREVIIELVRQLPPGWQATALSAVLILYKESVNDYPEAEILARSK